MLAWLLPVLGAAASFAAARAARAFAASGRARRVRARLGTPTPGSQLEGLGTDATVTLEGVLRSEGRVATFFPYDVSLAEAANGSALSLGDPELAVRLDTPAVEVALAGPVQVVLGSQETGRTRPLSQAPSLGVGEASPEDVRPAGSPRDDLARGMFRILAPQDPVRVRGRLRRTAGEAPAGYRQRATAFTLTPPAEGQSIPLVSLRAPRAATAGVYGIDAAIAAGAALALSGAVTIATPLLVHGAPGAASPPTLPLAAASRPPCAADVQRVLDAGDPWRAREMLRSCDDAEERAWVALQLGDYEAASAGFLQARTERPSLLPTLGEAHALAFAGRNLEASAIARVLAPQTGEGRWGTLCVEAAYGRRGGDPTAGDRLLRAVGNEPRPRPCGMVADDFHLDVMRRGPFATLLEMTDHGLQDFTWSMPAVWHPGGYDRPVAFAYGASGPAVIDPRGLVHGLPIALHESALARAEAWMLAHESPPPDDPRGKPPRHQIVCTTEVPLAELAAMTALFWAYVGEAEKAKAALRFDDQLARDTSPEKLAEVDPWTGSPMRDNYRCEGAVGYALTYAAAAAAHAGDMARVTLYLERGQEGDEPGASIIRQYLRQSTAGTEFEMPYLDAGWWKNLEFLEAGASGDGVAVVKLLDETHSTGSQVLSRVAPRVTKNRDALVTWLRERFPTACLSCGVSAIVENAADRREAARLLGQADLESKWLEVTRAHLGVMTRADGLAEWIGLEEASKPR